MSIFKRIWSGMWSSRMEYILNNTLLALLEQPGSTLLSVIKMLSDDDYTAEVVSKTKNPLVRNFWVKEYDRRITEFGLLPLLQHIGLQIQQWQ